ncbi:hypothetical protein EDB83DRAFT_471709 [Lactarius deliciosus]|nr:hypothetical protein EDB83DRAFT_471709 [Lactarius deliciosus]
MSVSHLGSPAFCPGCRTDSYNSPTPPVLTHSFLPSLSLDHIYSNSSFAPSGSSSRVLMILSSPSVALATRWLACQPLSAAPSPSAPRVDIFFRIVVVICYLVLCTLCTLNALRHAIAITLPLFFRSVGAILAHACFFFLIFYPSLTYGTLWSPSCYFFRFLGSASSSSRSIPVPIVSHFFSFTYLCHA